jgi:hypothetical protein
MDSSDIDETPSRQTRAVTHHAGIPDDGDAQHRQTLPPILKPAIRDSLKILKVEKLKSDFRRPIDILRPPPAPARQVPPSLDNPPPLTERYISHTLARLKQSAVVLESGKVFDPQPLSGSRLSAAAASADLVDDVDALIGPACLNRVSLDGSIATLDGVTKSDNCVEDWNLGAGEPGGNRTHNPQIKSQFARAKTLEIGMISRQRRAECVLSKQVEVTQTQPRPLAAARRNAGPRFRWNCARTTVEFSSATAQARASAWLCQNEPSREDQGSSRSARSNSSR